MVINVEVHTDNLIHREGDIWSTRIKILGLESNYINLTIIGIKEIEIVSSLIFFISCFECKFYRFIIFFIFCVSSILLYKIGLVKNKMEESILLLLLQVCK